MSEAAVAIDRLRELEQLLTRHEVTIWPERLSQLRREAGLDRAELKRRILNLYEGTMGSLTDLTISRANGDEVEDERVANDQLSRLRDELWKEATDL